MKKIQLFTLSLFFALFFVNQAYADCRGCCSWHGGVCCIDGVTMCCDGTTLSAKCTAKGCNKCYGAFPIDNPTELSNVPYECTADISLHNLLETSNFEELQNASY